MGRKLYVGNLPVSADNALLEKKFGQCGSVESVKIITDRVSGQSKGFGFIEMSNDAEARKAIEELNGTDCDGKPIVVNEARPQTKKQMGFGGNRRHGGGIGRW